MLFLLDTNNNNRKRAKGLPGLYQESEWSSSTLKFVMQRKWKWQQCHDRETAVQKHTHRATILHRGREIRALSAKVTHVSPHSFCLTFLLRPFRCSIRINSIASEAAQSIRKSVDSAGRASISHGVTQSTRGDLRSSTVPADAVQANWRHYFRRPLHHKVRREKNALVRFIS